MGLVPRGPEGPHPPKQTLREMFEPSNKYPAKVRYGPGEGVTILGVRRRDVFR